MGYTSPPCFASSKQDHESLLSWIACLTSPCQRTEYLIKEYHRLKIFSRIASAFLSISLFGSMVMVLLRMMFKRSLFLNLIILFENSTKGSLPVTLQLYKVLLLTFKSLQACSVSSNSSIISFSQSSLCLNTDEAIV